MSIQEFKNTMDTFKCDLKQSGDCAGFALATSNLIAEFCSEKMEQDHYELVNEIMQFIVKQD